MNENGEFREGGGLLFWSEIIGKIIVFRVERDFKIEEG